MQAVKPDYAEVYPLFILSPEDPHLRVIEQMLKGYECFYYSNEYLSDKLNAGMTFALSMEWDYLMGLGSDNVYTPLLWDLYRDYFETGERYFSLDDYFVYDIVNERAAYFEKYVNDKDVGGIGAGRVTHRSILEDEPCIYKPRTNCGMDGFSAIYLSRRGFIQKIVETDGRGVMLDIKTNTNVNHPIEIWGDRTKDVDVNWIKETFGLVDMDILNDGTFSMLSFNGFQTEVLKMSQTINKEDAFNSVNIRYKMAYGVTRFKNVESYKSYISQTNKR